MEKIGTALLSFGLSGKAFHAPFISHHSGFMLVGTWERSTKNIQHHYPKSKSYSSLEQLLQDDAVDLVVINSPTYTHYDYTKLALLAGKHVVVEKAFTATVAEALELKQLAEDKGKVLSVFQNRRWDSDFKTVQKIITDGVLGDLVDVSFSYDRYNPVLSPKLHKETPRPGAGIVHDLGPHLVDQALSLFGMPKEIFATIAITRETSQIQDYLDFLLIYPALRVRLKSSYFVREAVPSFILHGKKGSFLKSRADVQEINLVAGQKPVGSDWGVEPESEMGLLHTEVDGQVIREKIKSLQGNYMEYYDGIHRSLTAHTPAPVTAQDGVNVMRILEAALESNTNKRIVTVE